MKFQNFKNVLRKRLPKPIGNFVHNQITNLRLFNEYKRDALRYKDNALIGPKRPSEKNLIGIIALKTHSLEKGLSHRKFKLEFGKNGVLVEILDYLNIYKSLGYNLQNEYILNAISALKEYQKKHSEMSCKIPWFNQMFKEWLKIKNTCTAGTLELKHVDSQQKNFEELAKNRYSIREFSGEKVKINDIFAALSIAMKTPSVCNRSPWLVYVIKDTKKINELLRMQGGFNGYEAPDTLLLVTVQISYFNGLGERNQAFIEGGLFTMSFLYALEYKNIAAVPLNAMFKNKQTEQVKGFLGLSDEEVLITFIAIGNFPEKNLVAKSFRPNWETVTQIY